MIQQIPADRRVTCLHYFTAWMIYIPWMIAIGFDLSVQIPGTGLPYVAPVFGLRPDAHT